MILNKKAQAGIELSILILSLFAFSFITSTSFVSGQSTLSEPSFCCEKTNEGGWCINSGEENCNEGFKKSPTSCETTSYCKLGTCYDSEEGICMENTPQVICDENGGTWDERELNEIPQCQLGCCVIADQAAFVPLVRCKRLSTLFGVESDYRTNINSEVQCIATAQSQDKGACVYEKEFERICEFTTKGDCGAGETVETVNGTNVSLSSQRKFYKDYLCSAEELNTVCARQTSTGCYQGDVYWLDSCGNRENVYSSNREISWSNGRIASPEEVCAPNDGSEDNCGNCDYLLGSRCADWDKFLGLGKPEGSDHYCQKTVCVDRNGDERKNGESWCVRDSPAGEGADPVGARYYRELCVDGDVRVEPCADFRNEVCYDNTIETSDGNYGTAACRVNRWQDCVAQIEEDDCTNIDRRDCLWLPPVTGMLLGGQSEGSSEFSNPTVGDGQAFTNPTATGAVISPITGNSILGGGEEEEETEETVTNRPGGICVPDFTPGQNFWEEGDAGGICGQANAKCIVVFEEGLLGGRECVENCECLEDGWATDANKVCAALGDCGGYINYEGEYTDDGYEWNVDGDKQKFSPNTVNKISGGFTGLVVGGIINLFTIPITGRLIKLGEPATGGFPEGSTMGDLIVKDGTWVARSGLPASPIVAPTQIPTPVKYAPVESASGWSGIQTFGSGGQLTAGTYTGTTGSTISYGAGESLKTLSVAEGNTLTLTAGETAGTTNIAVASSDGTLISSVEGVEGVKLVEGSTLNGAAPEGGTWLSNILGAGGGSGADALISGIQWAAIAYIVGQIAGPIIGLNDDNTQALSAALAGGAFTFEALTTYTAGNLGVLSAHPLIAGIVVAVVIFVVLYSDEETEIVTFNCMPWQAPNGGDQCEKCNDEDLPCSEYRCRALGQNCEVVNEGTEQEKCVNINPRDTNHPVITPNDNELTNGYEYTDKKPSPPNAGVKIIRSEGDDGCIQAFTPLKFGIDVNEPAQCKIDFNHTDKFDDMRSFMGGSNLYSYNHTEQFVLPGAEALQNSSLFLENDGEMNFFIRCRDKTGNENSAEYAVRFCVDPSPDNTAPQIKLTSIDNGGCVAADTDAGIVEFYINEPAECSWSHEDQDYDSMLNIMSCDSQFYQINALQLFTCRANLTGISRDDTQFYVRCKDQPGEEENNRNKNSQSYAFSLRGSGALKLKNLQPNGTIFGAVNPAPVELYVQTLFGCSEGKSVCHYSETGNENDYIMFFDTDKEDGIHTQRLDLPAGNHNYYVKCVDSGGNVVIENTEFTLDIDTNAPVVARVYEEDEMLKIVTVRDSECSYSLNDCDFTLDEGTLMPYSNSTNHVAEWNKDRTYYIKCRDEFRNEEADCSIIVRPTVNFL
jgi:hypothetical protein